MKERRKFILLGAALFCTIMAFCLVIAFTAPNSRVSVNNGSRLSENDNKNIPIKTEIGNYEKFKSICLQ